MTLRRLALFALFFPLLPAAAQPSYRPADDLLTRPALQRLVDLQVERDAAGLVVALDADDSAVRARAAFALASVQDSSAVPALLGLLDDPAPQVRADAAFALGQSARRVPAQPLLEALAEEMNEDVQRLLLEALGKKGDEASLVALATMAPDDALAPVRALAMARYGLRGLHSSETVAFLLEALGADDPTLRRNAAYYFGRSPQTEPWADRADALRAALSALAPDDPAAMHLLAALGRLEDPADAPRLTRWLEAATDWRIRVNAARALGPLADDAAVRAALRAALDSPSEHVAVTAAQILAGAEMWHETEVTALVTWIDAHPDRWRVTSPLLPGLATQGQEAFVMAELERRRLGPATLAYARGLPALASLSRADAFDELAEAAENEDARVAYNALNALADRWTRDLAQPARHRAYFDVFAGALRRSDLATAYAAAPLLSDSLFRAFGAVDVMQEVYGGLRTPEDVEPMTAILSALGETGDPSAAGLLQQAIVHPHPVIRATAAAALEKITGEKADLPPGAEPPERVIDWGYLKEIGPHPRLLLETEKGAIVLTLFAEEAPLTVQTILQLAEAGRFDGVPFHRVVPNFVIQGGDFERGDGFGGPGFSIRSEFTRVPYERGALGMASAGKDTEGSQYFITHSMQPHLDGRYTAFGVVTEGLDIVDQIYEDDRVVKASVMRDE